MHIWGKTHHFFLKMHSYVISTIQNLDSRYLLIQFSDLTQRTIGPQMIFMFLCWGFPSSKLARKCLRNISLILIKFRTRIDFFKKEMITQLSNFISYLFSFQLFVYTMYKFRPNRVPIIGRKCLVFRYLDIQILATLQFH